MLFARIVMHEDVNSNEWLVGMIWINLLLGTSYCTKWVMPDVAEEKMKNQPVNWLFEWFDELILWKLLLEMNKWWLNLFGPSLLQNCWDWILLYRWSFPKWFISAKLPIVETSYISSKFVTKICWNCIKNWNQINVFVKFSGKILLEFELTALTLTSFVHFEVLIELFMKFHF